MDHKDLRFFGFRLYDVGENQGALAAIQHEHKERLPDEFAPSGYGPSAAFLKESSRFFSDYSRLRDDMLDRARSEQTVSREEYTTLCRGERILAALGDGGSLKIKMNRLAAGQNIFNSGGLSDSALIGRLTGLDGSDGPKERVTITAEPLAKL